MELIAFPNKKSKKEGKKKKIQKKEESDFLKKKDVVICQTCGYKIVRPYPKDKLCPRCDKFVPDLYPYQNVDEDETAEQKVIKEFDTSTSTPSRKFGSKVRVKKKDDKAFSLSDEKITLQGSLSSPYPPGSSPSGSPPPRQNDEYLRFLGIRSKEGRNNLFFSNERFKYLLELANNLDYIATGILGGQLDKMLLISGNDVKEKCQFLVRDNLIYVVFGIFPDKKGKWILEQMAKYYSEIVGKRDVDNLTEAERYDFEKKFIGPANFIIKEYKRLQEVFTDKEIPYLEDWMRIDYLGLSSMSIGVISLLLDIDNNLNVDVPGEFENEFEEIEMKESLLTAKIEAIAANTLGNTGSYPRWIAVKLGFQRYRFLTFKKYQNDYFLSLLSEGNLQKLDKIESKVEPYLYHGIDKPFSGNLRPFNKLKTTIKDLIDKFPEHKIS